MKRCNWINKLLDNKQIQTELVFSVKKILLLVMRVVFNLSSSIIF